MSLTYREKRIVREVLRLGNTSWQRGWTGEMQEYERYLRHSNHNAKWRRRARRQGALQ